MELTIHRGARQVGGTVITIRTPHACIALDAGSALEGDSEPDKARLLEVLRSARDGIFLSHAHPDHSGLAIDPSLAVPLYLTTETDKLLFASSLLGNGQAVEQGRRRTLRMRTPVTIGDLRVTAFPVDHSVAGAVAFLVESNHGRLLYSGDLRLHGMRPDLVEALQKAVAGQIDVLLVEGTNLDTKRLAAIQLEEDLHADLAAAVQASRGLVLAHCSPQHVDRLLGMIEAARLAGRTFVADVYTAFVIYLLRRHYPKLPDLRRPPAHFRTWLNVASTRRALRSLRGNNRFLTLVHAANLPLERILNEPGAHMLLFRPSMLATDFAGKLPPGATLLYSAWSGYLEKEPWNQAWLPVLQQIPTENVQRLHTSGHISRAHWRGLVQAIQPRYVVPVHTVHAEAYREHFANALPLQDGETLFITHHTSLSMKSNEESIVSLHRKKDLVNMSDEAAQASEIHASLDAYLKATREDAPLRTHDAYLVRDKEVLRRTAATDIRESHWEIAIWEYAKKHGFQIGPLAALQSYQVPLKSKRSDKWGKVDLLGVGVDGLPVPIELKQHKGELILRAICEVVAYAAAIKENWKNFGRFWAECHPAVSPTVEPATLHLIIAAPPEYWLNCQVSPEVRALLAALADRGYVIKALEIGWNQELDADGYPVITGARMLELF